MGRTYRRTSGVRGQALGRVARFTVPAALGLCLNCCPDTLYEAWSVSPAVILPADEAPHCSGGEWWYYTGRLAEETGKSYGILAVIFHVPGEIFLLPIDGWIAHFAVLDESTGTFVYDQQLSLTPKNPSGAVEGFDLVTPLIQMAGNSGQDRLRAETADGGVMLDLALSDQKGAVLHGENGYIPYGLSGRSFYYSRPRMQATGTLAIGGQARAVTGSFWFDRQWGRDLTDPSILWDWFSVRLNDGTDMMVFIFRGEGESVVVGTYMPPNGDALAMDPDDIAVTASEWWTSPRTGRTYPVRWTVGVPGLELALDVAAAADDQEIDSRPTSRNVYWEGLCHVSGTQAGQPATGIAFVELTNYP